VELFVALVVIVGLIVIGCIIASFFVRRHRESVRPAAGWQRTDEVFIDPSTSRQMRVWLDDAGERRYVEEGHRPSV
jgi:hypothetical protein